MAQHRFITTEKTFDLIKTFSPGELRRFYDQSIGATVEGLANAAIAYAEMKNRGMDLSFITKKWAAALELISGQGLKPELVIKFFGDTDLLRSLAAIVPEDQEKLVPPEVKIPVLCGTQVINLPPAGLSENQRKQVFGDGRIRTPAEQKPYAVPPKPYQPRAVAAQPAIASPSAMRMEEAKPDADWDVHGCLTIRQRKAVIVAAAKSGISPAAWVARLTVARLSTFTD